MFLLGVEKMLGMEFTNIFYPKVVNDKSENDWEPFVAPESWSCGSFVITVFVQKGTEKIIS